MVKSITIRLHEDVYRKLVGLGDASVSPNDILRKLLFKEDKKEDD